ncbi:MAG: hypothetical protein QNJ29_14575 [Rhizobiaceae bacterium]|nr:hypothetical protein [Rhizobiaceae bacterium]
MQTLDAILASEGLANSSQMQNFLRFIVTKTIEGEADSIKGYTIGVDALGKPETFDPSTDPSVRVMAGRLRQAIQNYYYDDAKPDEPVIQLPKGTYVPEINFSEQPQNSVDEVPEVVLANMETSAGQVRKPFLIALATGLVAIALSVTSLYLYNSDKAVIETALPKPAQLLSEHSRLPVVGYSFEYDKNGMPPWITPSLAISRSLVAFSRFDEYRIVPRPDNSDDITSDYTINIFFSSSLRNNDLDAFVTLYRSRSNEILWSNRFSFAEPEPGGDVANLNRIESIVSSIMSPYGILYGDIISRAGPPPRLNCIRQIYDYFAKSDLQSYATGRACARQAVDAGNASSSMHAMLAFLYVEAHRRKFEDSGDDPLEKARALATRAIELNEANARAFQARFAVEKTSGNEERAVEAAQRAIGLNPYDRDILGDYAAYLTSQGLLEAAREPLRRATDLTPVPPAWLQFYQYLHADLIGDYQIADEVISISSNTESPLLAVARILAFERGGKEAWLESGVTSLELVKSDFLDDPYDAFLRRGFSKTLAKTLSDRIENAKASDRFAQMQKKTKS